MVTSRYDGSAAGEDSSPDTWLGASGTRSNVRIAAHSFCASANTPTNAERFEIDNDIIDACEAATAVLKKK